MKTNRPTFEAPPAPKPVSLPTPLSFHVIIEPREPKTKSDGGIILTNKSKRANRATDYVGKLVAVGALAFKARIGDMDITAEPNWPQLGDWVAFRLHAGQKLKLRTPQADLVEGDSEDEAYLLLCNDTDVVATFKSEEEAGQFYSWV